MEGFGCHNVDCPHQSVGGMHFNLAVPLVGSDPQLLLATVAIAEVPIVVSLGKARMHRIVAAVSHLCLSAGKTSWRAAREKKLGESCLLLDMPNISLAIPHMLFHREPFFAQGCTLSG